MAEPSSMPHLDENKNTSTLRNHVPDSDDTFHTSTNNAAKNIPSEYTYRSPISVKGNFSEINSNITVLSPKNLNILTPETEGGFVKSEVGPVQDFSNESNLNETENSFRTANGSILGEANFSFKGLNGSCLEETVKSPNNSIKNILDNTVIKVESPTQSLSANTSLQGTEDLEISFNDARLTTSKSASFTEVVPDSQSAITSLMGNTSSSPESKRKSLVKKPLALTSTVECPSEKQTSTEVQLDTSTNGTLNTTTILESLPGNQFSCTENNSDTSIKIPLDTTSIVKSSFDNQSTFSEDKPDASDKSLLGTSTLGSPVTNQTSFSEDKPDASVKSLLGTSAQRFPAANQTSFSNDKPDNSVKSLLDTCALASPAPSQTSFSEDKSDASVKSLLATSAFGSPAPCQTSFSEDKLDASVKSRLVTSALGSPAPSQTSFSEDKSDASVKSLLATSALGSPAAGQTSLCEDKPDTSVKSLLGTSAIESPAASQTSFSEDKNNTSIKSILGACASESPSDSKNSIIEDKPGISVSGNSLESPTSIQTFFTEQNIDAPIKSLLETTSSTELTCVNNATSTVDKHDSSVGTALNTTSTEVLPVPDSSTIASKQEAEGNVEADKSASFTVDNALTNDSLLSIQEEKTNQSKDLSCALDQASVGDCAFTDNSGFVQCVQPVETTPKNVGFRETSRLIDFSMIEDGCAAEEFPFKVPSIKLGSSNTPDQKNKDIQNASQLSNLPTKTAVNVSSEAFDGGLHEEIFVPCEDPFGMHKSDPFDLMGMDVNTNPEDNFVFKVPENPPNVGNEEFTDAVQFFKDPSSFQFLENIKTAQTETNVPRSSLYIKFDPLHSMFPSQSSDILQALKNEANLDPNKQINLSARESLGNILISFDSPRVADCRDSQTPVMTAPVKVYTEEELQQHLKVNELTNQEMLLKKQREMEEELVRKEKEMVEKAEEKDAKIAQVENLLKVHSKCLEEFAIISSTIFEKNKELLKKMETIEEENVKLKGDVKTLTDDLQSVETTFADFHKRYEQCKGMLKTYKDNEELLRTKLKEQEQAYQVLQDRTQESSEKASSEISSVKRASEAKIAVLEAQLKKAQLKISSLESDIKQIRIENSKLGGICDDLMEKVGKA